MIDLHTHTTASDGLHAPADLVARAHAAGVRILSVTDHDTIAGCDAAEAACREHGMTLVPGIEITAAADGADVHVLGYFIDRRAPTLLSFLAAQRRQRVDRVRAIVQRLRGHDVHLDERALLQPAMADPDVTIGRPAIARALVDAGAATDTNDAFDRWLARGRPAFVPREGPSPTEVFARIHEAGGLASLAHPGLLAHDPWIVEFAAAGLDALEAYHSDHDADTTVRYLAMADRLQLAVSGGSDYHGEPSHRASVPGCVTLPAAAFEALEARSHARRAPASAYTGAPWLKHS